MTWWLNALINKVMGYTNREIIESVLKRVNALAGTNGKLYHDNTGWYIINQNKSGDAMRLDESSRGVEAILSYLHGIEDAYLFISNKEGKL